MSQKTNPTLIGAFVLVGIALALAAGVVLSSGRLFKKTYPYVMVFDGNVSGLLPGAPIQYRGVPVGSVKDVKLVVGRDQNIAHVSVLGEIDPSLVTFIGDESTDVQISEEIKAGLRAQLEIQSLVTGLKKIMLVDRPDVPVNMRRVLDKDIPEIPTCPNLSDSVIEEIQKLPLEEIVQNTHGTLKNLNAITASLVEKGTVAAAHDALMSLQNLSTGLEKDLPVLTEELTSTLSVMRGIMTGLEPVSEEVAKEFPALITGAEENMKSFVALQANLNKTMEELHTLLSRNSTSRYQLSDALATFTELAANASRFLEYLERHPESLITGKPE